MGSFEGQTVGLADGVYEGEVLGDIEGSLLEITDGTNEEIKSNT